MRSVLMSFMILLIAYLCNDTPHQTGHFLSRNTQIKLLIMKVSGEMIIKVQVLSSDPDHVPNSMMNGFLQIKNQISQMFLPAFSFGGTQY